jgi:hypothetical protein
MNKVAQLVLRNQSGIMNALLLLISHQRREAGILKRQLMDTCVALQKPKQRPKKKPRNTGAFSGDIGDQGYGRRKP